MKNMNGYVKDNPVIPGEDTLTMRVITQLETNAAKHYEERENSLMPSLFDRQEFASAFAEELANLAEYITAEEAEEIISESPYTRNVLANTWLEWVGEDGSEIPVASVALAEEYRRIADLAYNLTQIGLGDQIRDIIQNLIVLHGSVKRAALFEAEAWLHVKEDILWEYYPVFTLEAHARPAFDRLWKSLVVSQDL